MVVTIHLSGPHIILQSMVCGTSTGTWIKIALTPIVDCDVRVEYEIDD